MHFDTFEDKSIAILYRQLPCQRIICFHNSSVAKTKTYRDLTIKLLTANDSVYSSRYRSEGKRDPGSSLQLPKGAASALHEMRMGVTCTDLDWDFLHMHNKNAFWIVIIIKFPLPCKYLKKKKKISTNTIKIEKLTNLSLPQEKLRSNRNEHAPLKHLVKIQLSKPESFWH